MARDLEKRSIPSSNPLLSYPFSAPKLIKIGFQMAMISLAMSMPFNSLKNSIYRLIGVSIGSNTYLGGIIDSIFPDKISIGEDCIIAGKAILMTHEFYPGSLRTGEIDIGDGVVVGQRATLLPGISVGDNAVIGAGSVVTKDVPKNTVVAENPAEEIKPTSEI